MAVLIRPARTDDDLAVAAELRRQFFQKHGMAWYETPEPKHTWVACDPCNVVASLSYHDYSDMGIRWIDDFYGVPGAARAFRDLGLAVVRDAAQHGLRVGGYIHPRAVSLQRALKNLRWVPVAIVFMNQEEPCPQP